MSVATTLSQLSDDVRELLLEQKTKKKSVNQYQRQQSQFISYLQSNYENTPINKTVLVNYLVHLITNKKYKQKTMWTH